MPDTSNKEMNADHGAPDSGAPETRGLDADQNREAPLGHAAENAQTFTPSMTMPGAGTPDGPADDGSPGGTTASNTGPSGLYQDAPAPTDAQVEDAALGGRIGR